jgi:DNA-nicking Smr family endonuclease
MVFKVGDIVSFVNDTGKGKILKISGNEALILNEFGFELNYPLKYLVHCPEKEKYFLNEAFEQQQIKNKQLSEKKKAKLSKKNQKSQSILEVDLHIEAISKDYQRLSNAEIIQKQVLHFKKILNHAMRQKIKNIVFIHGKGQGVLKAEIQHTLLSFKNIKFYDADEKRYGNGATELIINYGD